MLKYVFLLMFLAGCLDVQVKVPKQETPIVIIENDDENDAGLKDAN